jgi:hypothetical protein
VIYTFGARNAILFACVGFFVVAWSESNNSRRPRVSVGLGIKRDTVAQPPEPPSRLVVETTNPSDVH